MTAASRSDDLGRAFDFILRADMLGTRTQPFRHGTAIFLDDLPLRHDSNYLLIDTLPAGVSAPELAALADEIQGAAGLAHRSVMFRDAAAGERLAGSFADLGWEPFRGVVLAHRRPPERAIDTSRVVLAPPGRLRAAREANILGYPWCTPETARQLLAIADYGPVPTETFALFEDDEPASWADFYCENGVAQVESVATVERFRNRGFASAVVLRAVAEARDRGADLIFLCADASDWPVALYARLGFDEIGRYVKFTRTENSA